jgi:hypothetical protein
MKLKGNGDPLEELVANLEKRVAAIEKKWP